MTPLERAIAQQRNALLRIEQHGARQIIATYSAVERRLKENVDLLVREIAEARSWGIEVRPGWLFAQERYRALLAELQHSTLDFLHSALAAATEMQRIAVKRAPADAERLVFAALGPAPRRDIGRLRATFGPLPAAPLRHLIGRASNGEPLGQLISEIAPHAVEAVRNSLAYGVATGQNPRVIADDVIVQSGMSRTRALAIARTETLGAYRATTKQRFQGTRIVREWEWRAADDARTCPACAAMDATRHPIDEGLDTHPCCRCVMSPLTPSWADLGFSGIPDGRPPAESPEERFAKRSEADQLAILGHARLDAYNAGKITLADLVHETHSERWGPGRTAATLTELGLRV